MKKNIWNQLLTIALVATVGSTTMRTLAVDGHEKSNTYKAVFDKAKKFVQNETVQKVAFVTGTLIVIGTSYWFLKSKCDKKSNRPNDPIAKIVPIDTQPPHDPTTQNFQRHPGEANTSGWKSAESEISKDCPHPPQEITVLKKGNIKIKFVHGDITEEGDPNRVWAITNAAKSSLNGGGGIDGAIEKAAGRDPYKECQEYKKQYNNGNDVPIGSATITGAGRLEPRVNYIIHTVGPDCRIKKQKENSQNLLYASVKNTLEKASNHNVQVVSIPTISSGVYKYPLDDCVIQINDAAFNHFEKFPETSINEIRLISNEKKTMLAFINS